MKSYDKNANTTCLISIITIMIIGFNRKLALILRNIMNEDKFHITWVKKLDTFEINNTTEMHFINSKTIQVERFLELKRYKLWKF